ncbi:hypothetical protein GQX73_g2736 [Xylaria multiplex]|uniref:Uncharacterized protein n=1 Tax=Xylaria multiplex TaxID=323545 RepID=A0A7C8IV57_9PEZI|nr:hypothetical protein GQX73_g2736 [Xylaria multiplex]
MAALDPEIPAIQSAQLPVITPDVIDLVKMIDDGQSCNNIFRQLCASSLVANAASLSDLDTDGNRLLLHSMPLPLMRSLLMGTLGPHFYSKDAKRDNWTKYVYNDNHPGAYAAFLYIHHRRGAFLSQRETRQLIAALKKYSAGVKLYDDDYREGIRVFHRADQEALEFTQVIDDELRQIAHWDPADPRRYNSVERPRFATAETDRIGAASTADLNINALISMFESRCTIDESDPNNPDLDVFQLQSPIMVGNSNYMRRSLTNHLIDDHGSGSSTSKVFALTKSCLSHLGFEVKSTAIPLFVAWEDDQIDPAEVLGTVLADSRLPGHGYNVKIPGTRGSRTPTPSPAFDPAREHVFYWKAFLKNNLEQSLDELRNEAVAEKKADLAKKLTSLRRDIDEFRCLFDELKDAKRRLEDARTELRETVEAAEAQVERMQQACADADKVIAEQNEMIRFFED